jgi:hypothetical protein
MLHKGFANFVKQISLLSRSNYRYHPLITKKSFLYCPSLTVSHRKIYKSSLSHTPKATFSSFKDDFNEETNSQDNNLK